MKEHNKTLTKMGLRVLAGGALANMVGVCGFLVKSRPIIWLAIVIIVALAVFWVVYTILWRLHLVDKFKEV